MSEKFRSVYSGSIEHVVTINGPVYQIAKQSVNNWHGGFTAAAVAVVSTFFAHDPDFADTSQCIKFAKPMLKKSWFLFNQNRGVDSKVWSSLWRTPFVLQAFTHHFNYIQGRAEVPSLENEVKGPHTALALACATVCHILTLVAENRVVLQSSRLGNVWTAIIPTGNQYEFNNTVWGATMCRYLDPIKNLSDEHFALVVEETQ
ncbi:hypothetical protein PAXRUDRAFT_20425 [Paxillus rubicundulus Ve08.2h10]|uniref:Uncharacterized protein n=1 Tax=Paxillus rubicundulus Ve08.2h10 TaxID=930991 RepID=A0A0D0CEA8_9AGAM|nr:hypothetical protein PAXRUDRAFT_20425 [Paxillus rubicundulus Ve08.2h10]